MSDLNSNSFELICPVCQQSDQIQRVSTIMDSGTTNSVGFGISTPISLHPHHSSMMAFGSQSVSQLASRFLPGSRPDVNFLSVFLYSALFSYFCSFFIMYNWWGDVEDQTFGDLIAKVIVVGLFSIPPAGILMSPSYFFINYRQRRKIIPSQSQWDQAVFVIRSAFFCHRDETCFDSDSWDHVDSYVLSVYRHFA
jgi:hypothetical protein